MEKKQETHRSRTGLRIISQRAESGKPASIALVDADGKFNFCVNFHHRDDERGLLWKNDQINLTEGVVQAASRMQVIKLVEMLEKAATGHLEREKEREEDYWKMNQELIESRIDLTAYKNEVEELRNEVARLNELLRRRSPLRNVLHWLGLSD